MPRTGVTEPIHSDSSFDMDADTQLRKLQASVDKEEEKRDRGDDDFQDPNVRKRGRDNQNQSRNTPKKQRVAPGSSTKGSASKNNASSLLNWKLSDRSPTFEREVRNSDIASDGNAASTTPRELPRHADNANRSPEQANDDPASDRAQEHSRIQRESLSDILINDLDVAHPMVIRALPIIKEMSDLLSELKQMKTNAENIEARIRECEAALKSIKVGFVLSL